MPAAVRRWHEAMGSLRAALSARADAPIPALPVVPPPPPPGARAAAEQEAEQPQHQRDDRDPPKDVQREPETEQDENYNECYENCSHGSPPLAIPAQLSTSLRASTSERKSGDAADPDLPVSLRRGRAVAPIVEAMSRQEEPERLLPGNVGHVLSCLNAAVTQVRCLIPHDIGGDPLVGGCRPHPFFLSRAAPAGAEALSSRD